MDQTQDFLALVKQHITLRDGNYILFYSRPPGENPVVIALVLGNSLLYIQSVASPHDNRLLKNISSQFLSAGRSLSGRRLLIGPDCRQGDRGSEGDR